jgi:hypothetical protein
MNQGLYTNTLLFICQHILVLYKENNSHYTFHFHNIVGHQPIKFRKRLPPISAVSSIFPTDVDNLRIQNKCNIIFSQLWNLISYSRGTGEKKQKD